MDNSEFHKVSELNTNHLTETKNLFIQHFQELYFLRKLKDFRDYYIGSVFMIFVTSILQLIALFVEKNSISFNLLNDVSYFSLFGCIIFLLGAIFSLFKYRPLGLHTSIHWAITELKNRDQKKIELIDKLESLENDIDKYFNQYEKELNFEQKNILLEQKDTFLQNKQRYEEAVLSGHLFTILCIK